MRQSISNIFESAVINSENKQYVDITTKNHISSFITNVVITNIYNETVKQYKALNDNFHYVNYYNFFMGLRITQNRAELTENHDSNSKSAISHIRDINYSGDTTIKYGNLNKTDFGTDNIQYCESWGYANAGGFVHYFGSNLSIDQAQSKYSKILNDGLFEYNLLDITLEIMFYNENYQTGIMQVYQFLINNAGDVEKYKDTNAFFLSRYSKHYHQTSESLKGFLIMLDVLYIILLIIVTIKTILTIKSRFMDIFYYKAYTFKWYEILDVIILSLSYTNFDIWVLIFLVFEDVAIPFNDEEKFNEYAEHCTLTKVFWIVSSFLFFLLAIRLFRIMTERFSSFGALFETIKVALKDFVNFSIAVIILIVGFAIASSIILGSKVAEFENVWSSMVTLLFFLFEDSFKVLNSSSITTNIFYRLYFMVFVFIFTVFLMKMFIIILIIRYKYLRSITQLDNEANARLLKKKGDELK